MRSRSPDGEASDDLFRARLSNQLDGKHPLVRLAGLIEWDGFDAAFGALYHETLGRPGRPTRLMVGVIHLQHSYDLSDEQVCQRWLENPYCSSSAGSISCGIGCRPMPARANVFRIVALVRPQGQGESRHCALFDQGNEPLCARCQTRRSTLAHTPMRAQKLFRRPTPVRRRNSRSSNGSGLILDSNLNLKQIDICSRWGLPPVYS